MKPILVIICVFLISVFSGYGILIAHPGRLDSKGGHYNHKTGEYHYHRRDGASSKPPSIKPAKSKSERKTKPAKSGNVKEKK